MSNNNYDICFYHKYCSDGLASAWCVKKNNINNDCNYLAMSPNFKLKESELNNYYKKKIICVDIMPNINTIEELLKICESLTILDHHKTNESIISKFTEMNTNTNKLNLIFDMNRAGCQITYDYMFNNTTSKRKWFIDYIGDRDLWSWKLDMSKEINLAMYEMGHLYSFDSINKLDKLDSNIIIPELIEYGNQVIKFNKKFIKQEIKKAKLAKLIFPVSENNSLETSVIVSLNNVPSQFRSDYGNDVLNYYKINNIKYNDEDIKISANYQYDLKSNEWWISLRSLEEYDVDVAKISEKFNGGGHKCAAGFTIYGSDGLYKHFAILDSN